MDVKTYALKQLAGIYEFLDATLEGLADEQLLWIPPGTANPIGLTLVHALWCEDMYISVLRDKPQVWQTHSWAEKFNLSEPPGYGQDWTVYRRARLTVDSLLAYRDAVRLETQAYVEALTAEELDRSLQVFGGSWLAANVFGLGISHLLFHAGEIAALKGVYGVKGLPF